MSKAISRHEGKTAQQCVHGKDVQRAEEDRRGHKMDGGIRSKKSGRTAKKKTRLRGKRYKHSSPKRPGPGVE